MIEPILGPNCLQRLSAEKTLPGKELKNPVKYSCADLNEKKKKEISVHDPLATIYRDCSNNTDLSYNRS